MEISKTFSYKGKQYCEGIFTYVNNGGRSGFSVVTKRGENVSIDDWALDSNNNLICIDDENYEKYKRGNKIIVYPEHMNFPNFKDGEKVLIECYRKKIMLLNGKANIQKC